METQRNMTETRTGNTLSKFTAIHRPWPKLRGGICRYKTFCMRIFARRTFLRFRFCSIHVKIHVLLTYSVVKRRVYRWAHATWCQRYHPSAAAQLLTPKKTPRKIERGEFITPPRPTGSRSNQ